MISELITLTTTPTSITSLVATARTVTPVPTLNIQGELFLQCLLAETFEVHMTDANSVGTSLVLQGATEGKNTFRMTDINPDTCLLSVDASTETIGLIFSKGDIS